MSTSPNLPRGENTFVIDESSMEMAWLLNQDQVLTRGMGSLFPDDFNLSQASRILDVACGPGGWVLEVARAYPEIEVTGFDVSVQMIHYARAQARAQGLDNAHFEVMNALQPLKFADSTFDLVNARTIVGFMHPPMWPILLQEMVRVGKPSGIICLTEFELPLTTSPAFEQINELAVRAFQKAGRNFSPDNRNLGTTAMLKRFLRNSGCTDIRHKAHAIDFSAKTDAHESVCQDYQIVYHLLQPFLVKMGVTTQEDVSWIYQKMLAEMLADDFNGIWFYLSAWGRRP